jgi:hypothetical protein
VNILTEIFTVSSFSPNCIIGFLEIYEKLIYCPTALPLSTQKLLNIWSVINPSISKSNYVEVQTDDLQQIFSCMDLIHLK